MPFRSHFAKKEAREHQIAQNALASGDLKQWHKHEAKAHRAGSHARGNGLMHTEYMSLGKENMAPPMGGGMPVGMPMGMPMDNTPIYVPPTQQPMPQSNSFGLPGTMSATSIVCGGGPVMPPMDMTGTPIMPMVGSGYDMYDQQMMPANTIYEGGMTTMEPTIIMEPAIVEEARTIVEYGEPIAPMTMVEPMMPMMMETSMMPAVMSGASYTEFTETQYGAPQFVSESVTMM